MYNCIYNFMQQNITLNHKIDILIISLSLIQHIESILYLYNINFSIMYFIKENKIFHPFKIQSVKMIE